MQDVCDRILESWGSIFKPSMGPLNIRYLKTAYGDFVDLKKRVVGDLFDDRGTDGNIRNSILEVHRYPPMPDQLETLQRFASLAPTSSARPQKRPLELPSQPYSSQNLRNIHREMPSIEVWDGDAEANRPFGTANKRQRTSDSRLERTFDGHQQSRMREEEREGLYHSSQTSGTQGSIHQVLDSQKSPGKKHPNPYGTPTSLSLINTQEPIPVNEIDLSAIPDSPPGRETTSPSGAFGGAIQLDREHTKSESPELRSSVHELPPSDPIGASGQQHPKNSVSSDSSAAPFVFNSTSRPISISQIVDEYAKKNGLSARHTGEIAADVNQNPDSRTSTRIPAQAQTVRSGNNTSRKLDPIFDPIESDTESFHEKQQMQSAKRLRSSKASSASFRSPRASNNAGADRKDGQFLVPSVPPSRTEGTRIASKEITGTQQCDSIEQPASDPKATNTIISNDLQQHHNPHIESFEHSQSEPCETGRTNASRETLNKDAGRDDPTSAQRLSHATSVGSQDSVNPASGTRESILQQVDSRVSSEELERDETASFSQDVNALIHNPEDDRSAHKAEQPAEEAKEEQGIKKIRERKAEQKQLAQEKEDAAKKKAVNERKANGERLTNNGGAKEENARARDSAQTKKAKSKEEELPKAKRNEEMMVNAARLAEEKNTRERLARERQIKETALAEEANKVMLAAEGTKQIDAEKKKSEKARLKEMAAKKQADAAKAAEQASEAHGKDLAKKIREERLARIEAKPLADVHSQDAKQRILQAGRPQEPAKALKKHGQNGSVGLEVQKLRGSAEVRSRSSTSMASTNTGGPNRSMTPFVPGSSATTSSNQISLGSSPLSSRSPGNMEAPLRSALRQTPSGLRRSLSSVSFDVPPRAKLNEYIHPNNELATRKSSAKALPKNSTKPASNAPSKTPMRSSIPKGASVSKITKTPAKNGKVKQTKLNVTREVKKLKGRAVDPPITSTPAPKQEIVLSSGEESRTSEEPVWQTGNAKAGPSKPMFPVKTSQGKKIAEAKPPGPPIDPVIRTIKVEKIRATAPAVLPRSPSQPDAASLQNSISRSPAHVLSETMSLKSASASISASETQSESESASEDELQSPSSKTPTDIKNGKLASGTTEGVSKAVTVVAKQSKDKSHSKASSRSSEASSSRPSSTVSMHDNGRHVDQAADKQLQLESRQLGSSPHVKHVSSTVNGSADGRVINQGLDHAGRLPNGMRPAYFKYPTLSELKKIPRAVTPLMQPKLNSASSQPLENSGSDTSSSESGSDSDEDENIDGVSSQTSSKNKSGCYPRMGKLIKLANTARAKLGSSQQ